MRDPGYGRTLLVGAGGAALAAVAAVRDWARASGDAAGAPVAGLAPGGNVAPLALALSLVALAAWGAVLVLHGRVRRAVSALGLLASAGALSAALVGVGSATGTAAQAARDAGASAGSVSASLTAWSWMCALGAVLTTLAFALAVVWVGHWPQMSSRYDAPQAAPRPRALADAGESAASRDASGGPGAAGDEDRELWRALDRGHDPTA